MTREELIDLLKADLCNEVRHMLFYLRAATEVQGLHREEIREFFVKEAHEEMNHVQEFSDFISYLGGCPDYSLQFFWEYGHNPYDMLTEVVRMEQQVASNYASRLQMTEAPSNPNSFVSEAYDPAIATAHVFYEDQIKHSQMTAWEVSKWLTRFPIPAMA